MVGQLILLVLAVLAMVLGVAYLWESVNLRRPGRVIYVGSNVFEQAPQLIQIINRYILDRGEKTEAYRFIEPGAGLALMSGRLATAFSWKQVIAIEIAPVIMWLGKVRLWLAGKAKAVTYRQQDLFSTTYPAPSVLYCYLLCPLIDRLYQEGKLKGNLVVSLTFPITNCPPTEVIPLKSWQKQLYVYDFRATA